MRQLTEYIKVFDVNVDDWITTEIQSLFSLYKDVEQGLETKNYGKYKYLVLEKYKEIPESNWEKLHGPLQMGLVQTVDEYKNELDEFKYTGLNGSESFLLTNYSISDYVIQHADYLPIKARSLTFHLTLNDGFTGGEFSFFNGEYKITPKKNQVIIFPTSFIFNYELLPITSGQRWAAENWTK